MLFYQGLDSPYSPRYRDNESDGRGGGRGGVGRADDSMASGSSQHHQQQHQQLEIGPPSSSSMSGSDNNSNGVDDGGGRRGYVSRGTETLIRTFALCESAASLRQAVQSHVDELNGEYASLWVILVTSIARQLVSLRSRMREDCTHRVRAFWRRQMMIQHCSTTHITHAHVMEEQALHVLSECVRLEAAACKNNIVPILPSENSVNNGVGKGSDKYGSTKDASEGSTVSGTTPGTSQSSSASSASSSSSQPSTR